MYNPCPHGMHASSLDMSTMGTIKKEARKEFICTLSTRPYHIWVGLMSEACDVHHIRPVVRLHQHSGGMSTRDVEGSRAAAVGTLDTGPGDLLNPVSAEDAFLED